MENNISTTPNKTQITSAPNKTGRHRHTFIATVIKPTCEKPGEKDSICSGCGKDYKKETLPALGHTYGEWKQVGNKQIRTCTKCGKQESKITFGQYPQSKVTGSILKKTLSNLAGTLPESSNGNGWTSYKYYIKDSNSIDFMWYKDVTHNGERYRGVYFTEYRPYRCSYESTEDNTNQKSNGYTPSTLYWFKYEPIQWRILEEKNGYATLLAEKIIDSQDFYHDNYSDTQVRNGKLVYANNYAQSDIRAWLNDLFYRTAFTSEQQSLIQAVTVDNSARSTNSDRNANEWNSGENSYSCENTTDKVWLLSEQEVTKASYGFNTDPKNWDTIRRKTTSDYAKCQGAYTNTDTNYKGKGFWWLRSPYYGSSDGAWRILLGGNSLNALYVTYTSTGVVPALKIKLS